MVTKHFYIEKNDKYQSVDYYIRPMELKDIPEALQVARDGWDLPTAQGAEPDFSEMFASRAWRPFFYVAVQRNIGYEDHVIGIAGYSSSLLYWGVYEVFWVGVRKDYQRWGIGTELVNIVLHDIEPLADVIMLVTDKPNFYEKWDFEVVKNIFLSSSPDVGDVMMLKQVHHGPPPDVRIEEV